MLSSFATKTITRLRYPTTSDQGITVTDWAAAPAESAIGGCWYEPINSTIDLDGRTAVRTGYTVAAPAGIDLNAKTDRVRIGGVVHELDGQPLEVPSPTGALDSTKFTTRNWEG